MPGVCLMDRNEVCACVSGALAALGRAAAALLHLEKNYFGA